MGQGEAQGALQRILPGPFGGQQGAHGIPPGTAVVVGRVLGQQPGIGDGPLGDHPQARGLGGGQHLVQGLLAEDVEGHLEGVEDPHGDRLQGVLAVAAVAGAAHLAGVARPQQRLRRLAGAQDLRRAGVQEDEIERLDPQPLQRPVDAALDDGAGVRLSLLAAGDAAALGGDDELAHAACETAADELLAAGVAVGGVDEGDAQVREAVEEGLHLFEGGAADARRPEAVAADLEIGGAEPGEQGGSAVSHRPPWRGVRACAAAAARRPPRRGRARGSR